MRILSRGIAVPATLGLVLLTSCHRSPTAPSPPASTVFDPPSLTCPVNQAVSGTGASMTVSYPAPALTSGTPPVSVTCSPASGSPFSPGTTTVSCSATDAAARQAQCAFNVTFTPLTLLATRLLAFGDSVTQGENGLPNPSALFQRRPMFVDTPHAYPTVLQGLLSDAFPTQAVTVFNEGLAGECAVDSQPRLDNVIGADRPDALLLLDGYNDLLLGACQGADPSELAPLSPSEVANALRADIDLAHRRGVQRVFLSEMTPPLPGAQRVIDPQSVIALNQLIDQIASSEGAVLVKAYSAFVGHETEYVSDGLHLTPAGYQVLAQQFFQAIVSTATTKPSTSTAARASAIR